MQEKHEFGLVVASTKLEAKNLAKSRWLIGYKKKHKDDIAPLKILTDCDDCELIKKVGNWEIELNLENKLIEESNNPDCLIFLFSRPNLSMLVLVAIIPSMFSSIINWQIFSISKRVKSGAIFTNNGGQSGRFLISLRSSFRRIGSCNFLNPSVFGELTFIAA